MESKQFDVLTRMLSTADFSRRQALQALGSMLLGGALGGMATRLGLAESVEAKTRGMHQSARKRKVHQAKDNRSELAATRKHKKKHSKKHQPPAPLPPGCQHCGTCEMCQDGSCAPDPDLDLVRCLDSANDPGGQCHICQGGVCVPLPNGFACNDGDECSWCQNGQCVASDRCCDNCGQFEKCCGGQCVPCPTGGVCGDGTCGCGGELSVACPPNPERPNGYCCEAQFNGTPFHSCVGRACQDCPEVWGCHYGIPPWDQ